MNSDNDVNKIIEESLENSQDFVPSDTLLPLNAFEFLEKEIQPQQSILHPIIPEKGLVMIHAPRGIGKTQVSLWIAYVVASGQSMFSNKWTCEKPRKVLFVDGEMPEAALQERLKRIVISTEKELEEPNNLRIINPNFQDCGIPDLMTQEGQRKIEEHLDGVDLIIFDNMSALFTSGKENEAESWVPIQGWLLSLRKRGIAVLFIHHTGKNGNQRGTSKKEDLLDTVILLEKPKDYDPKEGARFQIHYEKARNFYGKEANSFEVTLKQKNINSQEYYWEVRELEDVEYEKIIELHKQGLNQKEIHQETGITRPTVNRRIKRAREEGRIS